MYKINEVEIEIINGKSIRELEELVKEVNDAFDWRTKKDEIANLDATFPVPTTIEDLPGTKIVVDSIEYRIHGVVHDGGIGTAEYQVSEKVRDFIREKCREYHKPNSGEDYVCEDGLENRFHLNTKQRMRDIRYYAVEKTIDKLLSLLTNRPLFGPLLEEETLTVLLHQTSQRIKEVNFCNESVYRDNILKALDNPAYLLKLRLLHKALLQAPPTNGPLHIMYEHIKRSRHMAKCMKNYAQNRKLHTLHGLTGLGHEYQIATFLHFSDYPSKLLLLNIYPPSLFVLN